MRERERDLRWGMEKRYTNEGIEWCLEEKNLLLLNSFIICYIETRTHILLLLLYLLLLLLIYRFY